MVKTATNHNGDKSKRRHQNGDKNSKVKTATIQNGDMILISWSGRLLDVDRFYLVIHLVYHPKHEDDLW